jgi:hypothetical protein
MDDRRTPGVLRLDRQGSRCGNGCSWQRRLPQDSVVAAWHGKQGGARVIYFTRLDAGELCMLLIYPKSVRDNIPGHILRQIRKEIEDEDA